MTGCVYFIAASDLDMVKIGTSSGCPHKRLADLQTGSPALLDLISFIPGDRVLERQLHSVFADQREHGEWFHLSGKLATLVFDLATPGYIEAKLAAAGVYG